MNVSMSLTANPSKSMNMTVSVSLSLENLLILANFDALKFFYYYKNICFLFL